MLIRPVTIALSASLALAAAVHTARANAAPAAAPADAGAADDATDADEDAAANPASKPEKPAAAEKAALAPPAAPTPAPVAVSAEKAPALPESPLTFHNQGWSFGMYGFVELDVMSDSTQSFSENVGQSSIARPNTVAAGDNPRNQFSARNSRLGFKVAAPEWSSVKASAVVEMDFFGGEPQTTSQGESYTAGPMRMRHYYAKVESPIVDVLAGRKYHDLFGWGGAGFYPNSVAASCRCSARSITGIRSSVCPRPSRARPWISRSRQPPPFAPCNADSAVPDFKGGLKLNVNGWQGAATPGREPPGCGAALARRFRH